MAAQGDHFNINKAIKLNKLDSRQETSGMTLISNQIIYLYTGKLAHNALT